jgi:twitching motility protein PilT
MFELSTALRTVVERQGSDLHVKAGAPARVRIDGRLQEIEGWVTVTGADTERALLEMLDSEQREEFARDCELDFSHEVQGVGRFRVNAFRQRGTVSIVCRTIPEAAFTVEQLGLPPVLKTLAEEERGLVLATGPTGSGKSTTLAAMIGHVNANFPRHIVTIEDPIEYTHADAKGFVNQREVGQDTASYSRALRRVLRQDPDVVLIGEMRDEESVRVALSGAETGQLVMSTLHTLDAVESVNRIVDFFEPHEQPQARAMLAATLKGVVSQRLVPAASGSGRVAACEILVMTGRVRDLILDPTETIHLPEVVAEGEYYGMQTFDQALLKLLRAGEITLEDATRAATRPHDFKLMVDAEGQRASSVEQLYE